MHVSRLVAITLPRPEFVWLCSWCPSPPLPLPIVRRFVPPSGRLRCVVLVPLMKDSTVFVCFPFSPAHPCSSSRRCPPCVQSRWLRRLHLRAARPDAAQELVPAGGGRA